jgi:PII-like signaling protein
MKGYQISFIAEQDRRIEGKPATEWLIRLAKDLGIAGTTTFAGVESFGADGRHHSARFIELADQPIEVMMAVTEEQAADLIEKIKVTKTRLFYIKTPIEYGELGTESAVST